MIQVRKQTMEEWVLKWEITQEKGKWHFIVKKGILGFGLSFWLISSTIMYFFQPQDPAWLRPLVGLILFPFSGIFFGISIWTYCEWLYKKNKKN